MQFLKKPEAGFALGMMFMFLLPKKQFDQIMENFEQRILEVEVEYKPDQQQEVERLEKIQEDIIENKILQVLQEKTPAGSANDSSFEVQELRSLIKQAYSQDEEKWVEAQGEIGKKIRAAVKSQKTS